MRASPCASFLVPAWNAAATISDSLRSALAQTRRDIEVIVIDDGSTDGTQEIVGRFMGLDDRVTLIRQERNGPAAARNLGERYAQSPYLCLLDADDLVPPGKIQGQVSALDAHPEVSVVFTPALQFHDGMLEGAFAMPDPGTGDDVVARLLSTGFGSFFPLVSTLIRRTAYQAVGGIREFNPLVEDVDLWVRLAGEGHRFHRCEGPPALYRLRPGSRSSDRLDYSEGLLPIHDWLWERRGAMESSKREALRVACRYRSLVVGGLRWRAGDVRGARRAVVRAMSFSRRWGERLECMLHMADPSRTDRCVPLRATPQDETGTGGERSSPRSV